MSSKHGQFRQLGISATHQLPGRYATEGRFLYVIKAKPLNAEWTERHIIERGNVWAPSVPLATREDAILALHSLLEELLL